MRTWTLLLCFLVACTPALDDDDVAANDDDTSDDDDATMDDDDLGDDDDATTTALDCDSPEILETLESLSSWSTLNSCGSAFFSVATADQTVRFGVSMDLPEENPGEVGTEWTLWFDDGSPPDDAPGEVVFSLGENLSTVDCNDAIEKGNTPQVQLTRSPVGGSVTLTVDAIDGEEWPGGPVLFEGTVSFENLMLATPDGSLCRIPNASWSNRSFGWLAG